MKNSLSRSFSARARRLLVLTFALATPFAAVQLSGCGGGGGGGGSSFGQTGSVTATFRIVDENGIGANGLVTLQQGGVVVASAQTTGNATQFTIAPGTYRVILQVAGVTTPLDITVAAETGQTFLLTSGVNTPANLGVTISGVIRLNPTTGNTALCTSNSTPITSRVIVRVRDANQSDQPIVSSTEKPKQSGNNVPVDQRGTYLVGNVPGPGTYFIEVVSARATTADPTPGQFTGRGPVFVISPGDSSRTGVNVCANAGTFAVGDVP